MKLLEIIVLGWFSKGEQDLFSSWVLIAEFLFLISILVALIKVLDEHRNVGSCNF